MCLTYKVTVWKAFYTQHIFIKTEHVKLDILLPDYKTNISLVVFEIRFSQICNCKDATLWKVLKGQSKVNAQRYSRKKINLKIVVAFPKHCYSIEIKYLGLHGDRQ